jgi:Skp family chaperone for outer membrane proteins
MELIGQVEWIAMAESLGIPAAVLFAVLFFIWRTSKACAPYLRKMFDKHMEFVDVAQENSQRCVEVSEKTTQLLEEIHTSQKAMRAAMSHAASALEELSSKDNRERVKTHTSSMRDDLLGGV